MDDLGETVSRPLTARLDRRPPPSRGEQDVPEMPAALLCIHPEDLRGRRYELRAELAPLGLGRDPTMDLIVPSGDVSRRHCTFRFRDGAWVVEDEGSMNGTFVNDERVSRRVLRNGDQLTVGGPILKFFDGDDHETRVREYGAGIHFKDGLTELGNRRKLELELERLLEAPERPDTELSIVALQLDGIDQLISERLELDGIVKQLAELLRERAGPEDVLAHTGHSKLVWVLPGVAAGAAAERAEDLRKAVQAHRFDGGRSRLPVSISAGVVGHRSHWDKSQLLDQASAALYAARQVGNVVRVPATSDREIRTVSDGGWLLRKVLTESRQRTLLAFEVAEEPSIVATLAPEGFQQWTFELLQVVDAHLGAEEYLGRQSQRYVIATHRSSDAGAIERLLRDIEDAFRSLPAPAGSGLTRRCRSAYMTSDEVTGRGNTALDHLVTRLQTRSNPGIEVDALVQRLPHPLALPHFFYLSNSTSLGRAKSLCDGIEQYLRFVVALELGWLRLHAGRDAEASIVDVMRSVDFSKPFTMGAWMQVARRLARLMPESPRGPVRDMIEPLGATRGQGAKLQRRLEHVVWLRNDVFHTQGQNEQGHEEEETKIRTAFLELTRLFGSLRRTRLVSVDRVDDVEWDEEEDGAQQIRYVVRDHTGPQEVFQTTLLTTPVAIKQGQCVLLSGDDRPIPLSPLYWSGVCEECKRVELFVADGLWRGALQDAPERMAGVATGHKTRVQPQLKAWDKRILEGVLGAARR